MTTRFVTAVERPRETDPYAGHDVRFYEGDAFPAKAAAEFLAGALRGDGTALVFAKPEHTRAIARALAALGVDFDAMKARRKSLTQSSACARGGPRHRSCAWQSAHVEPIAPIASADFTMSWACAACSRSRPALSSFSDSAENASAS